MKIIKKYISLLLICLMVCSSLTPVNAKEYTQINNIDLPEVEIPTEPFKIEIVYPDTYVGRARIQSYALNEDDYEEVAFELEDLMLNQIMNLTTADIEDGYIYLDVSSLDLPPDFNFLNMFCLFSPLASAYFGPTTAYMDDYGNKVLYLEMTVSDEETLVALQEYCLYVETVTVYLSTVANKLATDVEKALYIHDYLVQNTIYGEYYNSFGSAGPLFDSVAVCEGYAYAFKYMMNLLDIECDVVQSESMNHAWNIIKIGGKYYHVDVTWDDTIMFGYYDQYSNVEHSYFLLSDAAISVDHSGWNTTKKCTSTNYDQAFWTEVSSPIVSDGEYYYYMVDQNTIDLVKCDIKTNQSTVIHTIEEPWPGEGGGYYIGTFSGLNLIGNTLYFNTSDALCAITTDGQNYIEYYHPDTNSGAVFGSMYYWQNGMIEYVVSSDLSYDINEFAWVEENVKVPIGMVQFIDENINIEIGETVELGCVVDPFYVETFEYTINVSDPTIVSVVDDVNMIVTGLNKGTTTITITTTNGVSTTCTITVDYANPFDDVTDEKWYTEPILRANALGLMTGKTNTHFGTVDPLSRAAIATVLYRISGETVSENAVSANKVFPDVSNTWYTDAITWAYSEGVVTGHDNGTFKPNDGVTRQQFALMLQRYAKEILGEDVSADEVDFSKFTDGNEVASWAKEAMQWAIDCGIITGNDDGTLRPKGVVSRAQCAVMIMRFYDRFLSE